MVLTIEDNAVFYAFLFLFTVVTIFIVAGFFNYIWAAFNAYVLGIFKRPLPDDHSKYFDVNCINEMSYQDFLQPNQVQRCREMRPINRPGPPRRF